MFGFKVFLLFWVIAVGGKTSKKGKDFSQKKKKKKRLFLWLVLAFSQIGKICNFKAIGSAVIAILKKLS